MTKTFPQISSPDRLKDVKPKESALQGSKPVSEFSLGHNPSLAFKMLCGPSLNTSVQFDTKGEYYVNK
jgi:hypothetical protein